MVIENDCSQDHSHHQEFMDILWTLVYLDDLEQKKHLLSWLVICKHTQTYANIFSNPHDPW